MWGMSPRERANWFDTEGNLYSSPVSKPLSDSIVEMCISQQDRSPLDSFAEGLHYYNIGCRIGRETGKGKGYRLAITHMEDIARELTLELPFIRSQRKIDEIKRFIAFVRRDRRATKKSVERAIETVSRIDLSNVPIRSAMSPMDRANWYETEGHLGASVGGRSWGSGAELTISQSEEPPLRDFAAGCVRDGVSCKVFGRKVASGTEYVLRIRRLDQIALELCREIPYFRTGRSLNQVQSFLDFIHFPRTRISESLELARQILPSRLCPALI